MNQSITPSSILQRCTAILIFLLFCSAIQAQAVSSSPYAPEALPWKPLANIQQIIQQELTQTNAELAGPNLTDWSSATLEAYRSLLTFTQIEMQASQNMPVVLDKAFRLMQTEVIPNPASRLMVIDDMKAKQVELTQKLTLQ